jgi:hypothetical protein
MTAAAALQTSSQQLTDQLQDLGGSAAEPAAAAQLQQLLSSEVKAWLAPLAQQQPLRKLSVKHVLRLVGLQYLKRCAAVVRKLLGATPGTARVKYCFDDTAASHSIEILLEEQLCKAAAAAAPQLAKALKEELASSGSGGPRSSQDKLRQVLQQLLLPSNGFRVPDSLKVELDAGFEFRYLIEQELEKQGCVDLVYARLRVLHEQLQQLHQEALVGLQMSYAEHLDLFVVERNAAAAAPLQALQAAASAGSTGEAAAAQAAVAGQPGPSAAPVHTNSSSSSSTTWPPWPAADSAAAPPELVAAVKQFCEVINSSSGFAAKAERACSLELFGTRASEKEQKDYLLQR